MTTYSHDIRLFTYHSETPNLFTEKNYTIDENVGI